MLTRLVVLSLALSALSACGAYEFEIETSSPSVRPTSIEFREVTSRGWLPGCSDLDVLQGTGFHPTSTYHTPSWEQIDTTRYRARAERGVRESLCATRVDEINHISLERGVAGSGSTDYARFSFDPAGDEASALVLCSQIPGTNTTEYEPIRCNNPQVSVVPGEKVRFDVMWP
ncbi:MAG: hypothetical protein ACO3JL_02925 [Myxococcota bacterium]